MHKNTIFTRGIHQISKNEVPRITPSRRTIDLCTFDIQGTKYDEFSRNYQADLSSRFLVCFYSSTVCFDKQNVWNCGNYP